MEAKKNITAVSGKLREARLCPEGIRRRAQTRLLSVTFWSTPDGGGTGVDNAYPFAIEDYMPPPQ